jgi:hypothetical protein
VTRIHRAVETRFPGLTDNFPFQTCHRFRITNPGHSKILDVSNDVLVVHRHVLNIEDVLEQSGVFAAMQASTNKQRVLWGSRGVVIESLI